MPQLTTTCVNGKTSFQDLTHIPQDTPLPFTNSFCRNFFVGGGLGEVWGTFPGYVGKIIESWA